MEGFKDTELKLIASTDIAALAKAHKSYGNSWKKRGGTGAFMMLARKIDRIELAVEKVGYDVFEAIRQDRRPEGIMDDIRDLRRYLLLVESEFAGQIGQLGKDVQDSEKPGPAYTGQD